MERPSPWPPPSKIPPTIELVEVFPTVGPNQRLHFLVREVPQKVLLDHGFRL